MDQFNFGANSTFVNNQFGGKNNTKGVNYIGNAFSLQMLGSHPAYGLSILEIHKSDIEGLIKSGNYISVVGHQDTADMLGVEYNRVSSKLNPGDTLYVAQYVGGRLEEGATTVPSADYKYYKITLI